jgi:hypothetical protein
VLSLTYFSTSTTELGRDELLDLLSGTRARNESLGLTGVLLYADGSFVQTLEGPDEVVDETFERISRDPRHRSVHIALREEVSERSFPDWSMGFREISRDESHSVPGFTDYLDAKGSPRRPGRNRADAFHRAFRAFLP